MVKEFFNFKEPKPEVTHQKIEVAKLDEEA